jgi:hypothetical protein
VKVVRKYAEANQINAEAGSKAIQLLFDPNLAVIVVLAGERICSQQKTASNDARDHMDGSHDLWAKHFSTCESRHSNTPL